MFARDNFVSELLDGLRCGRGWRLRFGGGGGKMITIVTLEGILRMSPAIVKAYGIVHVAFARRLTVLDIDFLNALNQQS